MKLKEYQERTLKEVKAYLGHLAAWRERAGRDPDLEVAFDIKGWEKAEVGRGDVPKKHGAGRQLPVFCLKIPTGGGKTLLAVKTVDLVQSLYLKSQTGLAVWIVPTLQIYRQTLQRLKDRDDPYRQHLDMVSAGKTLTLEKTDGFTPQDVDEHLCVLLLMLPSAARANKEALRMFRDAGAFAGFFPAEEDREGHAALLKRVKNLETFEGEDGYWGRQVKTSLGNTIRLLQPLVILDEAHKAYPEISQKTVHGLNASLVVELSATPPKEANKLVVISGEELHKEEMIKLDLHVVNKASTNWRDTMRAAMARRDELEAKARDYEANTNVYIRPICLVQVGGEGQDPRDGKLIHAEDVREYLIGQGVQKDWVAVKSAQLDELKDYDDVGGLMVRECPIRYIITKQALQEGWDCSFAYVLTILTNPHSKTAMTQLVGRILRQPYARKTHVPALDESYVYCFQRTRLLDEVREGFKREGLEEMAGRIVKDTADLAPVELREVGPRKEYKAAVGNMVLPAFVMRDGKDWRLVSYEADVLSRVRWSEADVSPLYKLELSLEEKRDVELRTGLAVELSGFARRVREEIAAGGTVQFDFAYAAGHLLDVVPNPWVGYEFVERVFTKLLAKWQGKETVVANNLVFILEELRKRLEAERDRLAKTAFNEMLDRDEMRFIVVARDLGMHRLPKKLQVPKSAKRATRLNGSQFEMNLFDPVPAGSLNSLEHEVASFLDEQSRLYFWYRNIPHYGYYVQGWQKSRIYADFIFTANGGGKGKFRKVFVWETKGLHLKNENTDYKRSVFTLCNKHAKKKAWNELVPAMRDKEISYEVVFQDEWEKRLNQLLG